MFKQPRVPEYRAGEEISKYIKTLTLFLKDFCHDAWIESRIGVAANSLKLGGKEPAYYIRHRSLIDNGDLKHPVNQRGRTSYSGSGYTVDRWRLTNAYSRAEVTDRGVVFSCDAEGTYAYPRQITDGRELGGKMLTAVFCTAESGIQTVTGVFPAEAVASDTTFARVQEGVYLYSLAKLKSGSLCMQMRIPAGRQLTLEWADLVEGEVTAKTYQRNRRTASQELDACHAYFYRFDQIYSTVGAGFFRQSGSQAIISLYVPYLREDANPTVTGRVHLAHPGTITDDAPVCTTFSAIRAGKGWVRLTCTPDSPDAALAGSPCMLTIREGDYLEVSREE